MAVVEADVELAAGRDGELAVDSNLKMVPEIKMEQVASPLMQVCNFFRPIATKKTIQVGAKLTPMKHELPCLTFCLLLYPSCNKIKQV